MAYSNLTRLTIVVVAAMSQGCMAQPGMTPVQSRAASDSAARLSRDQTPPIVTDFSALARDNAAGVVNVSTRGATPEARVTPLWPPTGNGNDPLASLFQQFSSEFGSAPGTSSQSLGTGFIINPDGYILTNSKVVSGATRIRVTLRDGREFKAELVGNDPASGIALLKIPATGLSTVVIGSTSDAKAGQWVASIGSPYGLNDTVTAGIISNIARTLPQESYIPLIQTDLTEGAGDAGSPVFNLAGDVVGIETPVNDVISNAEGLAFAIPIDEAMKVERQLQQFHKAQHGRLGIAIQDVSGPLAQSFGLAKPEGALVSSVDPGGPSAKSGLRPGDVILQINGVAINDSAQLPVAVADLMPGSTVRLTYWRGSTTHDTTVVLGRLNEATSQSAAFAQASAPDGLTVRGLTPDEQREIGARGGVRVEKSVGPAAFAGIEPGDVILMVNNARVSSPAQFRQKVETSGNAIALLVLRNGQRMFVTLDIG
ncbi:trypsin-like peptidase domain-containing protein [Paraburkholderia heleia]|uniref:trypsin-like peptidase domain-containing protein n=1 Tax=Paraburkholderia heleia TaxID=634127 RepID=UPI0005AA13AC|nr:trypsin-like peptidase domain-containing protein [Paraburkholderia heleia]